MKALCRDLHGEIRKSKGAQEKAKAARTVKDMDEFNRLYMGVQSRVIRIMSVESFFEDEVVRIGLGAAVTRAKQELSFHRLLKAEDLTPPPQVSTETEETRESSTEGSNADDDYVTVESPPRSPYYLSDELPLIRPQPTQRRILRSEYEKQQEDRRKLFETPQTLRSESPITPSDANNSPTLMPLLPAPLPPDPPPKNELKTPAIAPMDPDLPLGACAAPETSTPLPTNTVDDSNNLVTQVKTLEKYDGMEGNEEGKRFDEVVPDPDKQLATELKKLMLHTHILETLKATRPPTDQRYSGEDDDVDIDAHLRTFELVTDQLNVPIAMKLAELPFWFSGTALKICRLYDDAKDLDAAFVKIKQHLRREYSQHKIPLSVSLDRLLTGKQIDKSDVDGFLNLIIKLESLQRKAVERGKPNVFNKWAVQHILGEKLAFVVGPWVKECSKKWAENELFDDSNDELTDVDDEVNLDEFLHFLRRTHRQLMYEKRYYERKNQQQSYKDALSKPEKPGKKPPPAQPAHTPPKKDEPKVWSCGICKKLHFHNPDTCEVFLAMNLNERITTIRKHKRCMNCLRLAHTAKNCTRPKCRRCQGAHHELLHNSPSPTS